MQSPVTGHICRTDTTTDTTIAFRVIPATSVVT